MINIIENYDSQTKTFNYYMAIYIITSNIFNIVFWGTIFLIPDIPYVSLPQNWLFVT